MIFALDDIMGLRAGRYSERQVGEIHADVLAILGWRSSIVYLSADSLAHINDRHPDIGDLDLLFLPQMIRKGLLIRESAKPNILLACYQAGDKRYCASLKMAASTRFDVWVVSMRRMKPRQTRAMLNRGEMIRPHQS